MRFGWVSSYVCSLFPGVLQASWVRGASFQIPARIPGPAKMEAVVRACSPITRELPPPTLPVSSAPVRLALEDHGANSKTPACPIPVTIMADATSCLLASLDVTVYPDGQVMEQGQEGEKWIVLCVPSSSFSFLLSLFANIFLFSPPFLSIFL